MTRAQKMEENYRQARDKNFRVSSESVTDGLEEGFVFISMDEQRLAQVISVNYALLSMTGYQKMEVFGKQLDVLLPKYILEWHDGILRTYLESGKTYLSGAPRNLYLR